MAKGILIVNVPKNCRTCRRTEETGRVLSCCECGKPILDFNERPEWCPIKPMPERKEITGFVNPKDLGASLLAEGWNQSVDYVSSP